MIPEAAIENCDACAKAGTFRLNDCRNCLGRWLKREDRIRPGAFQAWCKRAAAKHGRAIVDMFLVEQGIRV